MPLFEMLQIRGRLDDALSRADIRLDKHEKNIVKKYAPCKKGAIIKTNSKNNNGKAFKVTNIWLSGDTMILYGRILKKDGELSKHTGSYTLPLEDLLRKTTNELHRTIGA